MSISTIILGKSSAICRQSSTNLNLFATTLPNRKEFLDEAIGRLDFPTEVNISWSSLCRTTDLRAPISRQNAVVFGKYD